MPLVTSFTERHLNGDSFLANTSNYESFILVRHPFSRLVSAYRDKLERTSTNKNYQLDYWYRTYGKPAVRKFREKAVAKFGIEFFSEENHFGSPLPDVKEGSMGLRTKNHPTFWEFVQLIIKSIDPIDYNNHWQPMHLWCSYCDINYKYIFQFERLSQESSLVKKLLDPDAHVQEVGWFNPTIGRDIDTNSVMQMYFEQLSDDDILALYKIYEVDFLSFGYTYKRGNLTLPLT